MVFGGRIMFYCFNVQVRKKTIKVAICFENRLYVYGYISVHRLENIIIIY